MVCRFGLLLLLLIFWSVGGFWNVDAPVALGKPCRRGVAPVVVVGGVFVDAVMRMAWPLGFAAGGGRRWLAMLLAIAVSLLAPSLQPVVGADLSLEEAPCIHDELESPLQLRALGYDVFSGVRASAEGDRGYAVTEVVERQPIRIVSSAADLYANGKQCGHVGEVVSDMMGATAVCATEDVLTSKQRAILLQRILPLAIDLHSQRLKVTRYPGRLLVRSLAGVICSSFTVPVAHRTVGVDADVVLYVATAPTPRDVPIWALPCAFGSDQRPTVGAINFSPRHVTFSRAAIRVTAHQIAHVLGFSYHYLARMGIPVRDGRARGKGVKLVASPRVVSQTQAYYNCSTAEGAELEDEQYIGYINSHWERRNAKDELMASIVGAGVYSTLTMALLDDLGVYAVNYTTAEAMRWGHLSGCSFLSAACVANGVSQYPDMFCTSDQSDACAADFLSYGVCRVGSYALNLPPYFRYFSDFRKGGTEPLMDLCPIVTGYATMRCTSPPPANAWPSFVYDRNARCVSGRDLVYKGTPSATSALCLLVSCMTTPTGEKWLQLRPKGGEWISCPVGGAAGEVSVVGAAFTNGTVTCPTYDEICTEATVDFGDDPVPNRAIVPAVPTHRLWAGLLAIVLWGVA